MSKWRLKGFVQDSDDDEEDLDTATERSSHDSQRANETNRLNDENTTTYIISSGKEGTEDHEKPNYTAHNEAQISGTAPFAKPNETTTTDPTASISPLTASAQVNRTPTTSPRSSTFSRRISVESPDPLLASTSPLSQLLEKPPNSSQTLGEPAPHSVTVDSYEEPKDIQKSSHLFLQELGIGALSDTSDSDVLSDPPSDLEDPFDQPTLFASPVRRTAVHVIIPRSSAVHEQSTREAVARSLRERKPIQLHPYALEGELYRRELQDRGIKPVPQHKSPARTSRHNDAETQEQEFDPDRELFYSSPPDVPVSTPVPRMPVQERREFVSGARPTLKRVVPVSSTPHITPSFKRRRIGRTSTQLAALKPAAPKGLGESENDVWMIPRSPSRFSSSLEDGTDCARLDLAPYPPTRAKGALPTSSQSSSFQGDALPETESDHKPILRSTRRSTERRRRPIVIADDSSSVSSQGSGGEEDLSESELRLARKKTKGVLPASWIAIDVKAQTMRHHGTKGRLPEGPSPELDEYQRGIARRVMKRSNGNSTKKLEHRSDEVVEVSDKSTHEHSGSGNRGALVRESAQMAADIASILDSRYADNDSEDMENDVLPLFTLGGMTRKRKSQTRLTDGFLRHNSRKPRSNDMPLPRTLQDFPRKRPRTKPKRVPRASAPALSVLDFELPSLKSPEKPPVFLKIAKRQARRKADFARQPPAYKYIMMQTGTDTEDANATLQQWKRGDIQPKHHQYRRGKLLVGRSPLTDIQNTQREYFIADDKPEVVVEANLMPKNSMGPLRNQQRLHKELPTFPTRHQSPRDSRMQRTALTLTDSRHRKPTHRIRDSFRPAQLEGLEQSQLRADWKGMFHRGLQEVDRRYELEAPLSHPSRNLQLARFLADRAAALERVGPAYDDDLEEPSTCMHIPPSSRRRPARKLKAQRLDVETRTYRQPSEPPLADVFTELPQAQLLTLEQGQNHEPLLLQGLGPHGTRYPTTFDVSQLKSDTYFHASTFIGGSGLKRALSSGCVAARDLDQTAGFVTLGYRGKTLRCGPWNDEVSSFITDAIVNTWHPLDDEFSQVADELQSLEVSARDTSDFLRSIINFISSHMSFLDPIDRQVFAIKFKQIAESLLNRLLTASIKIDGQNAKIASESLIRVASYLLVTLVQTLHISQHPVVASSTRQEIERLITTVSKFGISHLLGASSQLCRFLERNKQFKEREMGVQSSDIFVESTVICMHALAAIDIPRVSFWEIVSQELAGRVESTSEVTVFESLWGTLFTLLPFIEIDDSGIIDTARRTSFRHDSWVFVRDLLRRLFDLYPPTYRMRSSSLNDYVRTTLARCHYLIQFWHWKRCEHVLNTIFDFFANNGLRNLRREESNCSAHFLEDFTNKQALSVAPSDVSFHIFLKCIALALQGMKDMYSAKRIQSVVSRLTPNHGRSYPKDQPMDTESRDALRNHLDLLCTLYYASPPSCRPRLDLLRDLVQHETSHREACRLSVRAWSILATFQLSTDEPYASAKPLSEWLKEIIRQTLKQYHLAKTEAEKYLAMTAEKTNASSERVRKNMKKNQGQVIGTLRQCTAGILKMMDTSTNQATLRDFLIDSCLTDLLKLPHFEDARLVIVIRDILHVFRSYANFSKPEAVHGANDTSAEESQDLYGGESLDLELLYALEEEHIDNEPTEPPLDFIQIPLWNLLSNAFGATEAPDDSLLMDCVDTWALIASRQVSSGARTWSHYLDPHGSVSWPQLSQTEQTQKFGPYFTAALIENDPSVYSSHRLELFSALLLSLADREAMLRHQHRLLQALICIAPTEPLLENLPFYKDHNTRKFDINSETLRARRLALISSILANIHKDFHKTIRQDASQVTEARENYTTMLRGFMTAMKDQYLQLRQDTGVTGAYVEFVQTIVQFLQQYTADICPVIDFFTNSAAFPLPATDPTYVIGRLCGYAPKLGKAGVSKQLSVFVQTVVQQAAAGNQQTYLVDQLTTALCTKKHASKDQTALRNVLLHGIFPAYIEHACNSLVGLLIAKPILQSLRGILDAVLFDVHVFDEANVRAVEETVSSLWHAFIRGTEQLRSDVLLVQQPYVVCATAFFLDAMIAIMRLYAYTTGRCSAWNGKPAMVNHMDDFTLFILEALSSTSPEHVPSYNVDVQAGHGPCADLLSFCTESLAATIKTNWSAADGCIFFGQSNAKRVVTFDMGSLEEERQRLAEAYKAFSAAIAGIYGEDCPESIREQRTGLPWDVDV